METDLVYKSWRSWSMWLKHHSSFHWRAENITPVWNDEEAVTFLTLIHETTINTIFLSLFLHCFSPSEVWLSTTWMPVQLANTLLEPKLLSAKSILLLRWVLPDETSLIKRQTIPKSTDVRKFVQKGTLLLIFPVLYVNLDMFEKYSHRRNSGKNSTTDDSQWYHNTTMWTCHH